MKPRKLQKMKIATSTLSRGLLALLSLPVLGLFGCGIEAPPEAHEDIATIEADIVRTGPVIDDGGTICNNMHCCPAGYAMRGAHLGNNVYRCVQVEPPESPNLKGCYVESVLIRGHMRACKKGTYMRGLNPGGNGSLTCCDYASSTPTISRVDGNGTVFNLTAAAAYDGPKSDPVEAASNEVFFGTFMHVCHKQADLGVTNVEVMEGIHAGDNDFLCAS